jgi:alkanesulfonate monooxygenase SsuD/methylene tetrahydromethanopterin reductase-like flavin-dependent oxidoreductase (luciferase family)
MPDFELGLHFSYQSTTTPWPDLFEQSVEQLRVGRAVGVTMALVAEHHFLPDNWVPSPLVACAALSGRMPELTVGTDILILPLHHPVRVAEDVAVLDNISRGKFILGVALGWREEEFRAYGVPVRERVPRLVEGIALVRRLLAETAVTFRGTYHSVENVTITPRPVQRPHPPIWLGAIVAAAVQRAGELGLVWIRPPGLDLGQLDELEARYVARLDPALRTGTVGQTRPLRREAVVAATMERAWELARPTLDYEYGVVYREVYADYPLGGTVKDLIEYSRGRFLVGTPDFVWEEIDRYRETLGTTHVLLRMHLPDMDHRRVVEGLELLGARRPR